MSIKLYNGYRNRIRSTTELRLFLHEVYEVMKPLHDRLVVNRFAEIASSFIDQRALGTFEPKPEDRDTAPVWYAYESLRNADAEHTKHGRPGQFEFELAVYPGYQWTYFMTFCHHREYDAAWSLIPGVVDYHYQDQTDRPANITPRSWAIRRNQWERVLGPAWTPTTFGMFWRVDNGQLLVPTADVVGRVADAIPSVETRASRAARNVTDREHVRAQLDAGKKPEWHTIFEYARTDEYRQLVDARIAEYTPRLQPTITVDDLISWHKGEGE